MTKRNKKVRFIISEELEEQLESICNEYGLSKSEIARRGLVDQINHFSGDLDGD